MKIKLYNCLDNNESPTSEYALGLGYLKTNCKGADIEIVRDKEQLADCDIIGLSVVTEGVKEAISILESTSIPVIIGGQATLWEGLADYPFAHIVYGEGETALQAIINGGAPRFLRFKNIADIDTLNYPDRGRCREIVPIFTSRGCPWNCYFCSSQKYWGKPRYHSADYFISEVEYILKKYPDAGLLYILDDLFIANRERFDTIYECWMRGGFSEQLQLQGFVRSSLMTFDIARKLKRMGFKQVRFGAESGSNRILRLLNKRTTVEEHQCCVDICNEVGLPVCYSLMSFIPGETIRDRQLTGMFIRHNIGKASISGHYAFRPFPGTKFYKGESPLINDWCTRAVKKKKEEGAVK